MTFGRKVLVPPSGQCIRVYSEVDGSTLIRNIGEFLQDYTAFHPRRWPSSKESLLYHKMIILFSLLIFLIFICHTLSLTVKPS